MVSRSAIVCLLALLAAGCTKEPASAPQANVETAASPDEAPPSAPAMRAGAVDRSWKGQELPVERAVIPDFHEAFKFTDLDGKPVTFDQFKGKPLLVNLWATWCAPCVAEMPALDAAAAGVRTIALNQGEDVGKVQPFLDRVKLTNIQTLLDPDMAVSVALPANLPTTILYDAQGREVWRVAGARDWTTAESRALIAEAS